jgi:hypothetical protein
MSDREGKRQMSHSSVLHWAQRHARDSAVLLLLTAAGWLEREGTYTTARETEKDREAYNCTWCTSCMWKKYPPQGHLQQFPMFSYFSRILKRPELLAGEDSKWSMTVDLSSRHAVWNALRFYYTATVTDRGLKRVVYTRQNFSLHGKGSWDSSVGKVTKLLAGKRRICGPIPGIGKTSVVQNMQTGSGAHPTTYPVGTGKGDGALTLWVKWPEHETDHSPSSSAEAKNEWSYTSIRHTPSWREQEQLHLYL